ncbi:beta-ketoacyl-ACP synthase III [Luteococcus peritonei]|uniref:Beta-ketoacyl-[acyl-carrier-protein] synthase III n=1 Tax=Luteococcus peritonei TaxID=88874 RepID=A0ABW4RX57_9ACTN
MALRTSEPRRFSRVMSVGSARGSRVVDNAEMCTMIDSSDEWIQQRTGIVERRWAAEGEDALSLAVDASRIAVERSGLQPDQIDAVLLASISWTQQTPSMAALVAQQLGLSRPAVMDLSAACAGYCYGLGVADAMVRAGTARHVLVVGAEAMSHVLDKADRGTAFLFSDGAGASVVGPAEEPGISATLWGSDPAQADVITIDDWSTLDSGQIPYIRMDGAKVFRWATTYIADRTREVLEASGLAPEELDAFIPHQANNRITDSMLRHLKLPADVVVSRDITHMGNSSAASVPLAMDALLASGEARSGQTALLIGFGAGLAWAGQVVTLP